MRERRGAEEVDLPSEETPCPFCEKNYDSYEVNINNIREIKLSSIATYIMGHKILYGLYTINLWYSGN